MLFSTFSLFCVQSFYVGSSSTLCHSMFSHSMLGHSMLGFRSSVILCSVIRSFDVGSFDVRTFDVQLVNPPSNIKRCYKHRQASPLILISAISDIDICYSNIGRKYVRLKIFILMSVVPISTSESIPISDIKIIFNIKARLNPLPLITQVNALPLSYSTDLKIVWCRISDIR
jgi:hypothetical protein